MPKKSLRKKKERKADEYTQARAAKMNNAAGVYQPFNSFPDDGMKAGYRGGYKV